MKFYYWTLLKIHKFTSLHCLFAQLTAAPVVLQAETRSLLNIQRLVYCECLYLESSLHIVHVTA